MGPQRAFVLLDSTFETLVLLPPELETTIAITTTAMATTSTAPTCQMRRLRRCFLRSSASRSSRCLRASSRWSFLEAKLLFPLFVPGCRWKGRDVDECFVTTALEA